MDPGFHGDDKFGVGNEISRYFNFYSKLKDYIPIFEMVSILNFKQQKIKNFKFGLYAEYLVMLIYNLKFYSVLKHRMRNYAGEIDVICQRGKQLVFIEVKARKNEVDDILCTSFQQNKIRKAAEIYLAANPKYRNFDLRFDLVVVRPWKFPEIIENAW